MSSIPDLLNFASGMTEEQFVALPPNERRLLLLQLEQFYREKQKNPLPFFVPNGRQEEFISKVGNMFENKKLIFINASANGSGKTTIACHIIANLIYGAQSKWFDYPAFRKPWPFPKRIWYVSEADAFQGKVSPMIEEIFPPGRYSFIKAGRKFNSHLEAAGWTLDCKTYDQDVRSFEAVDVSVILYDEPPPQEIRASCVRGLRSGGIEIFVMTALEHAAWVYDEIVEKPEQQRNVFYMEAHIEDSCKEHGVRGHLEHERIEFLASQYDEDQKEARLTGKPKHLQGKVYRTLHPTFHKHHLPPVDFPQSTRLPMGHAALKDGEVAFGRDGFVVCCFLDVHDSRPPAITWWALDYDGHAYIIDEFPNNYDTEIEGNDPLPYHQIKSTTLTYRKIAEIIKYKEQKNGWTRPQDIRRAMDPNFGLKTSGESGQTVQQIIASAGVDMKWQMFFDATVSDDITNGHAAVRVLLATDPKDGRPFLKIGEHCSNTWFQMLRYSRKKPSAKRLQVDGPSDAPAKKYKDFPDTVRYGAMYYYRPTKESTPVKAEPHPNPYEADIQRESSSKRGSWLDWRPHRRISARTTRRG